MTDTVVSLTLADGAWFQIVKARLAAGDYVIALREPGPGRPSNKVNIATSSVDRAQLLELFKALAHEFEVPISRRI